MPVSQRSRGLWQAPTHSIDNVWAYGSTNSLMSPSTGAGTWPAAFMVIYVPIRVKHTVKIVKFWYGSAPTGTANLQMGIYNRSGTRLIGSASTAKTATSDEAAIDITDTTISPDLYYVALQHTDATGTFERTAPAVPCAAAAGIRTETLGSLGLPDPAVWTVNQTLAFIPMVGMLTEGTIT